MSFRNRSTKPSDLTDVSKPLKPEERREKNVLENIDINNYASEFYICPSNNTAINFKESFLIDQHKSITVKSVLRGHLWDKEKVVFQDKVTS